MSYFCCRNLFKKNKLFNQLKFYFEENIIQTFNDSKMSILIFLLVSTLQLHNFTSIECRKYLYRNDITQNMENNVINYLEHLESQLRSQNNLNLNFFSKS